MHIFLFLRFQRLAGSRRCCINKSVRDDPILTLSGQFWVGTNRSVCRPCPNEIRRACGSAFRKLTKSSTKIRSWPICDCHCHSKAVAQLSGIRVKVATPKALPVSRPARVIVVRKPAIQMRPMQIRNRFLNGWRSSTQGHIALLLKPQPQPHSHRP